MEPRNSFFNNIRVFATDSLPRRSQIGLSPAPLYPLSCLLPTTIHIRQLLPHSSPTRAAASDSRALAARGGCGTACRDADGPARRAGGPACGEIGRLSPPGPVTVVAAVDHGWRGQSSPATRIDSESWPLIGCDGPGSARRRRAYSSRPWAGRSTDIGRECSAIYSGHSQRMFSNIQRSILQNIPCECPLTSRPRAGSCDGRRVESVTRDAELDTVKPASGRLGPPRRWQHNPPAVAESTSLQAWLRLTELPQAASGPPRRAESE